MCITFLNAIMARVPFSLSHLKNMQGNISNHKVFCYPDAENAFIQIVHFRKRTGMILKKSKIKI